MSFKQFELGRTRVDRYILFTHIFWDMEKYSDFRRLQKIRDYFSMFGVRQNWWNNIFPIGSSPNFCKNIRQSKYGVGWRRNELISLSFVPSAKIFLVKITNVDPRTFWTKSVTGHSESIQRCTSIRLSKGISDFSQTWYNVRRWTTSIHQF